MRFLMTTLPSLPVPALEDTASSLLKSLEPLCAQGPHPVESLRELEEQCKELGSGRGGAAALQAVLLSRAERAEADGTSWIAEWWTKYAYLASRDPLPPKEGSILELTDVLHDAGQLAVASALVRIYLEG